jgi:hypothetical protein
MVSRACKSALLMAAALVLSRCNIEVGNPESSLPGNRSFQTLSFSLTSKTDCTLSSNACTAAPVMLSEAQSAQLSYEMTAIELQMSGLQLKPFAELRIPASLDLLNGTLVSLPEAKESGEINGIALRFNTGTGISGTSLLLQGNLTGIFEGERVSLPLQISYADEFLAETGVSAGENTLDGILFDATTWFDFSGSKNDVGHLIKALSDGACRSGATSSCLKYRENLAKQISERIARSMSIKTRPGSRKTDPKAKNPG